MVLDSLGIELEESVDLSLDSGVGYLAVTFVVEVQGKAVLDVGSVGGAKGEEESEGGDEHCGAGKLFWT